MWKILLGAAAGYAAAKISSRTSSDAVRPLAKAALKTGIQALEKGFEAASHLRESMEDVLAEARADLDGKAAAEARRQQNEAEQEPIARTRKPSSRRTSSRGAKPRSKVEHAPSSHD